MRDIYVSYTKIFRDHFYQVWVDGKVYDTMGNVPYRIENPDALFRSTKMNRINFVAYVDEFKTEDGGAAVEFVPSREDLKYTDRTKRTLQKVVDNFEANIIQVAQDDIDSATSHFDAYSKWVTWTNALGRGLFSELTYDGDAFEPDFKINAARWNMKQCLQMGVENGEWGVWGGIYLTSGKRDNNKNAHKTKEVWDAIAARVSG